MGGYREELILNVTVFVVRVWGGQYRDQLILNIIVFDIKVGVVEHNCVLSCVRLLLHLYYIIYTTIMLQLKIVIELVVRVC